MKNEALNERPAVKDEQGNICRVRKIWDKPSAGDRYTITFEIYNEKSGKWDIWYDGYPSFPECKDKIQMLGLNDDPTHPSYGISQFSIGVEGRHLGKRIAWSELPELIQNHIKLRMKQ